MTRATTIQRTGAAARDVPASARYGSEGEITPAERELLGYLAQGLALAVIARRTYTSERTLRRRIRILCERIGVDTLIEAVAWAARRGLI